MFGYVTVNKPEIKFKDFDVYRSFYCGLCRELRERYGIPGQISLTYDMTFVVLLLSGVYEPPTQKGTSRCAVHPLKPQPVRRNAITEYCADMNVILSYYKCMDDWQDEHKPLRYAYARLLKTGGEKHMAHYPEKIRRIKEALMELSSPICVLCSSTIRVIAVKLTSAATKKKMTGTTRPNAAILSASCPYST